MPACAKCDLIRADLVDGVCSTCRPKGVKEKAQLALGFGCLAIIAVIVISLCILVYGAIFGDDPKPRTKDQSVAITSAPAAPAPSAPAQEEVDVDISDIRRMFAENQVAGAAYFEHRTAIIPGRVIRVREALGTGILVMKSPKTGETIELGFNEQGTRELANVRSGDKITATCPSVNEMMGQIIIACSGITDSTP